jgi:hypothetical protein
VFRSSNNQSQMELEKRGPNHRITAKRFSATDFFIDLSSHNTRNVEAAAMMRGDMLPSAAIQGGNECETD